MLDMHKLVRIADLARRMIELSAQRARWATPEGDIGQFHGPEAGERSRSC
jgi:FlaA1/EpsC-like NDP-sugar epimerase